MSVRVLVADDHAILRAGLKLLLERAEGIEWVGEASNGAEAVERAGAVRADVVVMDLAMPRLNGIEASRQILAASPRTAIVVLSMHSDEAYVLRALAAGARAYVLKESAEPELLSAIAAAVRGRYYFSPKVSALLREDRVRQLKDKGEADSYTLLSAREREVLHLIAEGNANKDVANVLGLSLYTVETHRSNILRKLGLHSTADLIL